MAVRISHESRGVRCAYTGATSLGDLFRAVVDFTSTSELQNIQYVIHDLRAISSFTRDDAAMRALTERVKNLVGDTRGVVAAVVTQRADIAATVAEYCEATGRTVLIFPELADALQWAAGGLRSAQPDAVALR